MLNLIYGILYIKWEMTRGGTNEKEVGINCWDNRGFVDSRW